MTHVCRSWRNVLLSTPSFWTQIDFSRSTNPQQAEEFLRRSGNLLLDIYQSLKEEDDVEPFLSTTLHNLSRLQRLDIASCFPRLGCLLGCFSVPVPTLKHLDIRSNPFSIERDVRFPSTAFGGRLPKLTSLTLHFLRTDLRDFNLPSLTRFNFMTRTNTSVRNLTSFFEQCPLLEFIQIRFEHTPQLPTPPPLRRIRLGSLKELRLDRAACISGLLDHLILPSCTNMMLKGLFTGETFDRHGSPAAQIHPSSIEHLSVTRGITKAVAMPNSCIFSGPNGNLRFWCTEETRKNLDAVFFTSFSPIPVLGIRELWVGPGTTTYFGTPLPPWKQTTASVQGIFGVLTKVEDLTVVGCNMKPFSAALGATVARASANDGILLPTLQRLTIYVEFGDLDVPALIQCAKARKGHSRPLGEVTIVCKEAVTTDLIRKVESLREFVVEVNHRVGVAPMLIWRGVDCDDW